MDSYMNCVREEIDLCKQNLKFLDSLLNEEDLKNLHRLCSNKGLDYFLKWYRLNMKKVYDIVRLAPDNYLTGLNELKSNDRLCLALCSNWHFQNSIRFLNVLYHYLDECGLFLHTNIAIAGKYAHQELMLNNIVFWPFGGDSPF